ncbi:hypothetical protein OA344_00625 [Pseudomonadota bacterium]|nr:hypothetical protein [Pseudomonadota bacterium]
MKKKLLTLIEAIIIMNLGLALVSSIAVEMLWGEYFGFAILAGALAWGLPNWYFSKSFKANNFLGKLETLKINLFIKTTLRFLFILSIILISLLFFNLDFIVMISAFLVANLSATFFAVILNHRCFNNFSNNLKQY